MLAIEGACGVQFEPDEMMELRTVGAVVQRVLAARG
jgi:acyl carrier protein